MSNLSQNHPIRAAIALWALILGLVSQPAAAHLPVDTNLLIDFEVKENLLKIEPWMPTFSLPPLEDVTFDGDAPWPTPDERKAAIEKYFSEKCPIEIDGKRVEPVMISMKLVPMEQAPHLGKIINLVQARITLHYQVDSPPQKIKFRWTIFPPIPEEGWGPEVEADPTHDPQEFDLMMFVDGKEDYVYFSPKEPEFFWHRRPVEVEKLNVIAPDELIASSGREEAVTTAAPMVSTISLVAAGLGVLAFVGATLLKFPVIIRAVVLLLGLGIAGANLNLGDGGDEGKLAGVSEPEAVDIFETLQANLYSAFDFETEDQVYDVLAQSVDGKLLDDFYTEIYRSLLVVDRSKAVCKVHKVEVLECGSEAIDPAEDGTAIRFNIACHWRVYGVVEHYEHIHRRVNEYRADFRLTRKPEGWRITAAAVDQQDRLDLGTMEPVGK